MYMDLYRQFQAAFTFANFITFINMHIRKFGAVTKGSCEEVYITWSITILPIAV